MIEDDNKTLWCGNLSDQITEELLYELFLQAGPLEKVYIPRDRDGRQKSFAFITFSHDVSVPYAIQLFRGTALLNRKLSLQCRARMATLPPPIRASSLDQSFDFLTNTNVQQQFLEMTNSLNQCDHNFINTPKEYRNEDLVMASLQGNWSNRHHPYRSKDNKRNDNDWKRNDLRSRNNHDNRGHRNNHRQWKDNDRHHDRYDGRRNNHRRDY